MGRRLLYLIFGFLMLHQFAGAASSVKKLPFESYLFEKVVITGATNVNEFELIYQDSDYNQINISHDNFECLLTMKIPVHEIEAESHAMKEGFS